MPHDRRLVTLTLALAGACSPASFAWHEDPTSAVDRYRAAFVRTAGSTFVGSRDRAAFVDTLRTARVLWLGDHHRSGRLHALQSELLAELQAAGLRLVLLLEAIGTGDEPDVHRYVDGTLSMEDLRSAMQQRWSGSWLDDRELDPWYYRSLLSFARRHELPVSALEPTPRAPLHQRDALMAKTVARAAAAHPDRLLVVVVGQAHLLGAGDLVARVGLPSVVVGGEPTAPLRAAAPERAARKTFWQSDAGTWWFGEMLRAE